MSCLTVTIDRKDWVSSRMDRLDDFVFTPTRKGGIHCKVFQSWSVNIRQPYLEISPTIVWVLAGHTQNDVYSNTTWNVE